MVTFNGTSITEAAPVQITDVVTVGAPVLLTMRERIGTGAFFGRVKKSPSKVTVTFTLPVSDASQREVHMRALRAWCESTEPQPLYLPNCEGLYMLAVCSKLPDCSTRQWWQEMSVEFTVPDPYLVDAAVKSATLGTVPFEIGGTAPPLAYIAYTVPAASSDLTWELDDTYTFSLAGSVATGALVIDFNTQTALVGTASVIGQMPLAQSIPELLPGVHTLTGNGTIYWQERWV